MHAYLLACPHCPPPSHVPPSDQPHERPTNSQVVNVDVLSGRPESCCRWSPMIVKHLLVSGATDIHPASALACDCNFSDRDSNFEHREIHARGSSTKVCRSHIIVASPLKKM